MPIIAFSKTAAGPNFGPYTGTGGAPNLPDGQPPPGGDVVNLNSSDATVMQGHTDPLEPGRKAPSTAIPAVRTLRVYEPSVVTKKGT